MGPLPLSLSFSPFPLSCHRKHNPFDCSADAVQHTRIDQKLPIHSVCGRHVLQCGEAEDENIEFFSRRMGQVEENQKGDQQLFLAKQRVVVWAVGVVEEHSKNEEEDRQRRMGVDEKRRCTQNNTRQELC